MSDQGRDEEVLENKQRLKAALHYSVGEICSQVEGMSFSREIVAVLTETSFIQAELLATDLELFAKHAKRSTVSVEDVRLCSRRSPSLLQFITEQGEQLKAEREEQQRAAKEGGGGGKEASEGKTGGGRVGKEGTGRGGKEGQEKKGRGGGEDEEMADDDGLNSKKSVAKRTNKAGRVKKKTTID